MVAQPWSRFAMDIVRGGVLDESGPLDREDPDGEPIWSWRLGLRDWRVGGNPRRGSPNKEGGRLIYIVGGK